MKPFKWSRRYCLSYRTPREHKQHLTRTCLLLALPRELRDHISDYLSQRKTLFRALEQQTERPRNRSDARTYLIFYQVKFRPWPSATRPYMANRQISTEYHERMLAAFNKERGTRRHMRFGSHKPRHIQHLSRRVHPSSEWPHPAPAGGGNGGNLQHPIHLLLLVGGICTTSQRRLLSQWHGYGNSRSATGSTDYMEER